LILKFFKRYSDFKFVYFRIFEFARKITGDPEIYKYYFEFFHDTVNKYGILIGDIWNIDEKGYEIGTSGNEYIVIFIDIR
jgi:hypothetical protein